MLGGVVLGLVLGLAIVGFREFRDTSFRTEADVFNVLALPVLAAVPFAPTAADLARDRRQQRAVYMTAAVARRGRQRRGGLPASLEIHRLEGGARRDTRSSGWRTTAPPRRRRLWVESTKH